MKFNTLDSVWLLPLLFAAIFLLVAARGWWTVAHGKMTLGHRLEPGRPQDLAAAATTTSFAFVLLACAIGAWLWVRS